MYIKTIINFVYKNSLQISSKRNIISFNKLHKQITFSYIKQYYIPFSLHKKLFNKQYYTYHMWEKPCVCKHVTCTAASKSYILHKILIKIFLIRGCAPPFNYKEKFNNYSLYWRRWRCMRKDRDLRCVRQTCFSRKILSTIKRCVSSPSISEFLSSLAD